ncbi:MAG: YHS domain-containing protein [Candidatus Jettenia caeni]|nr:MAG: YHS domain-containing protein [Candidatus Jettenia caeni]
MYSTILRIVFLASITVGLSSTYTNNIIWAYSEESKQSNHESSGHAAQAKDKEKVGKTEVVIDPVCGMVISDIKKAPTENYKGTTYYFCSENCKTAFKKSPSSFLEGLLKR